jgi:hypothetical protein
MGLNDPNAWRDAYNDTPPIQYNAGGTDGRFYWSSSGGDSGYMTLLSAPPAVFTVNWEIFTVTDSVELDVLFSTGGAHVFSLGSSIGTGSLVINPGASTSLSISMVGAGSGCDIFTGALRFAVSGNGDITDPFAWQSAGGILPPPEFANDSDGTNF